MLKIIRHNTNIYNEIEGIHMLHYDLTKELTVVEGVAKLKNQRKEENILSVGCNKKGRAFVETDWYIYEVNVKGDCYTLPVMWSKSKKPFLIAGILTVLFLMFFVGGLITDFMVITILCSLGLVNVFKRTEIRKMKLAIERALSES